jgi:mannose-6-phosphate isomerase-like protein (cupin superfamily)
MPFVIKAPAVITAAGNKPKRIEEFVGRVNSGTETVSIARMRSPEGWEEPGQAPEFDEYTLVLKGTLRVRSKGGTVDVTAGRAVVVRSREWVQYSTPEPGGAEYIAVCLPAFSPDNVNRDAP